MDKLNELKALAELAEQLENNGHYIEANTVHNRFVRLAQQQRTYKVTDFQKPLREIADETGVSVLKLQYFNKGIPDVVLQGRVVQLGPAPRKDAPGTYTVSQGDTLSSIANKLGMREPSLLIKLNPGIEKRKLQPGTPLKIPVQKTSLDSEYPEMPLA
jgi:LysM repeat protein